MTETIGTRLPVPLTTLIGRDRELEEAAAFLQRDDVRILTLSGPGGTGKTRLAIAVGALLRGAFDIVAFVPLANVIEARAVIPAIAQSIGIREDGDMPIADRLRDALRDRKVLLILDNFEQVTAAATDLAAFLGSSPGIKALVTS